MSGWTDPCSDNDEIDAQGARPFRCSRLTGGKQHCLLCSPLGASCLRLLLTSTLTSPACPCAADARDRECHCAPFAIMTPQHHDDPEPLTDRCMAITEPDEILTAPNNAHIEGQRTGSVSRSSRPFPASLIPGRTNRIIISQSWKRLLPGRGLRPQKAAAVRSRTKESLDASARSPNSRSGTQSASRLGVRLC